MVHAPIGARVAWLPDGYETLWWRGEEYYYCDGIFYRYDPWDDLYVVVRAPLGIAVSYLPDYCMIRGRGMSRYATCGGVRYRPIMRDGLAVWLVLDL